MQTNTPNKEHTATVKLTPCTINYTVMSLYMHSDTHVLRLCFLDIMSIPLVGSDPIERKQTIGTRLVDSFHISSRFKITPSANLTPIDSEM